SDGFTDKGAPLLGAAWSLIDAHEYKGVLYFKSENADHISAVRLSADGKSLAGDIHVLLRTTERWEGKTVEAPWVIKRGSWYYMFYSGNYYCNHLYAVGVARAKDPFGHWEKHDGPI